MGIRMPGGGVSDESEWAATAWRGGWGGGAGRYPRQPPTPVLDRGYMPPLLLIRASDRSCCGVTLCLRLMVATVQEAFFFFRVPSPATVTAGDVRRGRNMHLSQNIFTGIDDSLHSP